MLSLTLIPPNLTGSSSNPMPKSLPKTDSKKNLQEHLYVLILAGGGGTRLWPLSRENSPKQFLRLFDGQSLFDLTLNRAKKLAPTSHIFISTSAKYVSLFAKVAKEIPAENIIAEPMRRDTALAMGLGAAYIYHRDPQAVIINCPSDHLIKPEDTYISEIKKAATIAYERQKYVVVGKKPQYAHPGYGHIKIRGKKRPDGSFLGEKFIEKPPPDKAKEYAQSKNYFWNVGQYIWPAGLLLDFLKEYAPKTYSQLPKVLASLGTENEREALQLSFQMAPTVSIDYAVSEKLKDFVLFPVSFSWSDIGDWSEIKDHLSHDQLGNVIYGNRNNAQYIGVNSKNNLLILDKQLVATVGIENLLIVDTPESILICNVNDDQAVKQVHQTLKEQGLTKYL